MTLARAPGFAASLADGSVLAPARAFIVAVASPVEIGILRGHLITETKKGQRREIMLDSAESAARRGEIRRRRRHRWKTVLPDDNLIAHERRRGRCRPVSSAAAAARPHAAAAAATAAATAVTAAADEAADEATNAPYNVLLVDARYSQR